METATQFWVKTNFFLTYHLILLFLHPFLSLHFPGRFPVELVGHETESLKEQR